MAWWLLARIASGDFTETQVRNAFGLTQAQWDALKTNKLIPYRDAWLVVVAARGE